MSTTSPSEPIIITTYRTSFSKKMMGMIAHHTGNLLEFGSSNRPHLAHLSRCTSNESSSSSCDMPEMITSASLQSFSESDGGDSLNDSLSSGGRRSQSPAMSPRSIFHSYWSSPKTKTLLLDWKNSDGGGDCRADDDVLERLRTLKMPLSDDGSHVAGVAFPARPAAVVVVVRPTAARVSDEDASPPRMPIIDDDCVDDRSSSATPPCGPSTTSTPRRRILPPPPPPAVVTPMRMLLPPPEDHYYDEYDYSRPSAASRRNSLTRRPWSSTTALGGRGGGGDRRCGAPPSRSCLRKSRYSFSSCDDRDLAEAASLASLVAPARLHPGLRNWGHVDLSASSSSSSPDMSRSVSFYSEVSVVEYSVPQEQRRSQEGWSRYFA